MNNKILTIIPARGGSKGVPRKNIKKLNGKPLVAYAIESALRSGVVDKVVVSTDDDEIANVVKDFGAEIIMRPAILATDTSLTEPVMKHALDELKSLGYFPDFVSLLQCTSPFLSPDTIRECVQKVQSGQYDSCITVYDPEHYEFKWKKTTDDIVVPDHDVENRPRRQDLDLPVHENGAFYITKENLFSESINRFGGNKARVTAVYMSQRDSMQIDTEHDFWLADKILSDGK